MVNYNKMVSIIIPAYNCESSIGDLIEQLKKQTYKNYEVIIIDDGSEDNTLKVIKEKIVGKKNFKVFSKNNEGVSVTRNVGISKSTGDYIMFIDSDDNIYSWTIEALVEGLNKNEKIDMVIGDYEYGNGQVKDKLESGFIVDDISKIKSLILYNNEIEFRYCNLRTVWGKLYKKDIIEKYKICFDEKIKLFEDGVFNLEYISRVNLISFIPKLVYKYNISNQSSVHKYYRDLYMQDTYKINRVKQIVENTNNNNIMQYYRLFVYELLCAYIKNQSGNSKKEFMIDISKILKNSIYTEEIKKIDYKKLGKNHKIIYICIKLKLKSIIYYLCVMKKNKSNG